MKISTQLDRIFRNSQCPPLDNACCNHIPTEQSQLENINRTKMFLEKPKTIDSQKPNNEDVETLCKSVEQICVTLWSNFLRLSTRSGQTLCQCISTSCKSVIRSTCELLENLSKCSKRHESLQKVGEVWQTYDEIKAKIPRDNVQAVNLKIQVSQVNLCSCRLERIG